MLKANSSRCAEDIASARLWLANAVPLADVLTMLEVRRRLDLLPADARVYAAQILWAVQHPIDSRNSNSIPTPEEAYYAVA